jgi:hypothetical protein
MRIALIFFLLTLIITGGCRIINNEYNNTVIINNTIHKETKTVYNYSLVNNCEEKVIIREINKTVINKECNTALVNCEIQKQNIYFKFEKCLAENNSKKIIEIRENMSQMKWKLNNCTYRLNNITKWFKNG